MHRTGLICARTTGYRRAGRSKAVVVLSWIRMTLQRAQAAEWLREHQMLSLSRTVSELIKAIGGVQKVSGMVLPLPYSQLLKWCAPTSPLPMPTGLACVSDSSPQPAKRSHSNYSHSR